MNPRSLKKSVSAAVGGAVLVTGLLVGAAFALAQDADDPEFTEESAAERGAGDDHISPFVDRAQLWDDNLSGVLGEIREQALGTVDEAVADGKLTEEQGKAIKERIEILAFGEEFPFSARDFRFGGRGEGFPFGSHDFFGTPPQGFEFDSDHFPFGFRPDGFDFGGDHLGFSLPEDLDLRDFDFMGELEEFAARLGTTVDQLREQFESGMTLGEILDDLGLDSATLAAEALEQAMARIDELVADGILSQERADTIKEMFERFKLGEGLPFGLRDFQFEFDFDIDGLRRFGDHGHGFGFFSDDGVFGEASVAEALLEV